MRLLLALLLLGGLWAPLPATEAAPAAVSAPASSLKFSKHARQRMKERGVSERAVRELVATAPPFQYRHGGAVKLGYHDPKTGLFAAATEDGLVITVIAGTTKRYIEGLKARGP